MLELSENCIILLSYCFITKKKKKLDQFIRKVNHLIVNLYAEIWINHLYDNDVAKV